MNPESTPQPAAPAATIQSLVTYYAGVTTYSATPAVLQLVDGRIQLVRLDPTSRQPLETIFNVLPAEITNVRGSISYARFAIAGKKYRLDFSQTAVLVMPAGLIGVAIAANAVKKSGIAGWMEALRGMGVDARVTSMGRIMAITFAAVFGTIALIILIAVVSSKLGGN